MGKSSYFKISRDALLPSLLAVGGISLAAATVSRANDDCTQVYQRIAEKQSTLRDNGALSSESPTSWLIQGAKDRLRQRLMAVTGSHHPVEYARADTVYRELNSYLAPAELERKIQSQIDRTVREIMLYPEMKDAYLEATAAAQVRREILTSRPPQPITELPAELRPLSIDLREVSEAEATAYAAGQDREKWIAHNLAEYTGWDQVYKRRLEILDNLQFANQEKGIEASYPIYIPLPTAWERSEVGFKPARYRFFKFADRTELKYTLEHFKDMSRILEERAGAFSSESTARPEWDFQLTSSLYAPKTSWRIEKSDLPHELKSTDSLLKIALGTKKNASLPEKLDVEQARRLEVLKIIQPDLEKAGLTDIAAQAGKAIHLAAAYQPPPQALNTLRKSELRSEWDRLKTLMADSSPGEAVRKIQKAHKVIWKFKMMADYSAIGAGAFYLGRYVALGTDFLGYDEKMRKLDLQTISCITETSRSEAQKCLDGLISGVKINVAGRSVPLSLYASRMNLIFQGHVDTVSDYAQKELEAKGVKSPDPARVRSLALSYLHKAESICSPKGLKLRSNDPGEHLESLMSCYAILASSSAQAADTELRMISLQNPEAAEALSLQLEQRSSILRRLNRIAEN